MKIHSSLLTACVASGLLYGPQQCGLTQDLAKSASGSKSASDFSGLKPSKIGHAGSLAIAPDRTSVARQFVTREDNQVIPGALSSTADRGPSIGRSRQLGGMGKLAESSNTASRALSDFGESLQPTQGSGRGELARHTSVSTKRLSRTVDDDTSFIATDLLSQPRLVK